MASAGAKSNFTCFLCSKSVLGLYSSLTKHLRSVHGMKTSNSTRAELVCGQNGCEEKFYMFSNYRYHLSVCESVRSVQSSEINDIETDNHPILDDFQVEAQGICETREVQESIARRNIDFEGKKFNDLEVC